MSCPVSFYRAEGHLKKCLKDGGVSLMSTAPINCVMETTENETAEEECFFHKEYEVSGLFFVAKQLSEIVNKHVTYRAF